MSELWNHPSITFFVEPAELILLSTRYLGHQLVRKSSVWIQTILSLNSHKSRLTPGTRWALDFYTDHFNNWCFWVLYRIYLKMFSCLQIFHKRMPPEAVDLVSRLLQYSPNLRCTAVSISDLPPCNLLAAEYKMWIKLACLVKFCLRYGPLVSKHLVCFVFCPLERRPPPLQKTETLLITIVILMYLRMWYHAWKQIHFKCYNQNEPTYYYHFYFWKKKKRAEFFAAYPDFWLQCRSINQNYTSYDCFAVGGLYSPVLRWTARPKFPSPQRPPIASSLQL